MKVAIVVGQYQKEYGGHEHYLAQHLAKMKHDVTIVTSNAPPARYSNKNSTRLKDEKVGKVMIKRLPNSFGFLEIPFRRSSYLVEFLEVFPLKNLKELLRKISPDIIHTHEHFQWYTYEAISTKRELEIPVILTQHIYKLPRPQYCPFYFLFDKTFGRYGLENADHIIAISRAAKEFIIDRVDPSKVSMIPTGVDTDTFFPQEKKVKDNLGLKQDEKIVITVTRFTEQKDNTTLIKAAKILEKKIDFKLLIIGRGPLKNNLITLVNRLGMRHKVMFVDYIPHRELPKYYSSSDVFVLTSIREPFGIVFLEAMACGIPVVGTNVGGVKDIIVNGRVGYLVEPRNYEDLANKILLAINDRKRLGKNALNRARNIFSLKVVAHKTEKIYLELVDKSKTQL